MTAKTFSFLLFFFLLQLIVGLGIIYFVSFHSVTSRLKDIVNRIHEDVTYHDGTWDTSLYNADPQAPGTSPLYILTSDGFVIDRWKPLHGFLDVSDFRHLLVYTTPQTIHTVTKQDWRIYSQPILSGTKIIGVISVSLYNPDDSLLSQIDNKLVDTETYIANHIKVNKNEDIIINNLDERSLPFDVAFQVVDQFNLIKAKNNNNNSIDRIPNFIDTSYVAKELDSPAFKEITDTTSKERFLLLTSPIYSKNNTPIGVIIAGKSISYIHQLLITYVLFAFPISILLSLIGTLSLPFVLRQTTHISTKKHVAKIMFSKKDSILHIDQHNIAIPYATNQYVLCKTLCASPQKRFDVDSLLERFGEDPSPDNSRKVYDAMNLLNKRLKTILPMKFIINKDKTYQINPVFASKIVAK